MISYDEALNLILNKATKAKTQTLDIHECLHKVCAQKVVSPINVPSFRNSAMDGYAICTQECANADLENPTLLPILGALAAGDVAAKTSARSALHVMTGALVPECYDAILPVEMAVVEENTLVVKQSPTPLEHIRLIGQDIQKEQTLLEIGDVITPAHIMLLSAVGFSQMSVACAPDIYVLSTGKELVNVGDTLSEASIYNSNSPYLFAALHNDAYQTYSMGHVVDDVNDFVKKVSNVPAGSVIISTGAVSKGVWDFIPDTLVRLGATIHVHKVNIRPGKPILFATLPNGTSYFGLPGNPMSCAVGYAFFVLPFLKHSTQQVPTKPLYGCLQNAFEKKGTFKQFLKAQVSLGKDLQLQVRLLEGQESFKITSFAQANAWAVLDAGTKIFSQGSPVQIILHSALTNVFDQSEFLSCLAA